MLGVASRKSYPVHKVSGKEARLRRWKMMVEEGKGGWGEGGVMQLGNGGEWKWGKGERERVVGMREGDLALMNGGERW